MQIKINGKNFEANENETIFDVAERNGIEIPTLCRTERNHDGVCRICVVEVGNANLRSNVGRNAHARSLQTACNTNVRDGMEIITESEKISRVRQINLELLWSDRAGKCAKCVKNRRCELQNLAEKFKIENFHFVPRRGEITSEEELDLVRDNWSRVVVDDQNPAIFRTTEYCVECRRCIDACPVKAYGFNSRGKDVVVGTPYEKTLDCLFCGWCVKHCPTAALSDKGDLKKIIEKLDDLGTLAVAILDPALEASFTNEFPENSGSRKEMVAVLEKLGFEKIFFLEQGMKLHAQKLSEEILERKNQDLVLSGHCPAFSRYVHKFHPNLEKNISRIPVPDELMAEWVKKEYASQNKIDPQKIFVVAVSSCVAKKSLAQENIDAIITMREWGRLVRMKGFSAEKEQEKEQKSSFDSQKFTKMIKSGGLLEAVRQELGRKKIEAAWVSGPEQIKKALEDLEKREIGIDFLEGMFCSGGCENGGGQSIKLKI